MKPKSKKGTGYRKESANNKASFWVPGSTSCLSFTLFISRTCFSRFLSSSSYLLPIHVALCNLWVCFLRLELPGEMLTLSGSESSQIPGKQLSLAWFVRRLPFIQKTVLSWAVMTKSHRAGGFNNRLLFSHGSGHWESKIKLPAQSASLRPLSLGFRQWSSHHVWRGLYSSPMNRETMRSKLSGVPSCKGINPTVNISWPHLMELGWWNYLPKAPSPNTIPLVLRIKHMNWRWCEGTQLSR